MSELPSGSYVDDQVRLWVANCVVELAPGTGRSDGPGDLGLGPPLLIVSGSCPPELRSTAVDNAASLARFGDALTDVLQRHGAADRRCRSVLLPQSRAWVEIGEAFSGVPLEATREFARTRGLRGFVVWDADGLRVEWTDGSHSTPRTVRIREVRPGCPMQTRHPGRRCVPQGGPWVAASQRAALFWTAHQRMLLGALGCGVCDGDRDGLPEVIATGDLIQPSRCGGWDFAGPTATLARIRPTR